MGKLKLGILGSGYLTDIIVEASLKGMLGEYELVRVLGGTRRKTEFLAEKGGRQACGTIDELLALSSNHVAEAASVQSVEDCGMKVLEPGTGMIMLSIGVFTDHESFGQIKAVAAGHKARVYIASNAMGGFDVLRAISLMGQTEVSIRTRRGPVSLKGTPLSVERPMEDRMGSHVLRGNAKGAISLLPTKVNVTVTSSLVIAGPEDIRVNICSAPDMVGGDHKITSETEGMKAVVDIYSSTSATAGWSVVAVLQNIVSLIVF